MTCYRPLQAVRTDSPNYPVVILSHMKALDYKQRGVSGLLQLPCGKCVGCRLSYSRNFAIRCTHESSLYEYNSFVTFTYNDYFNERNGGSLNYRDFQLFLKRIRFALAESSTDYAFLTDSDFGLRYFMCGEYGDRTFRPHFHALFFNLDFSDRILYKNHLGFNLYSSETLSSFWSDPVTHESYGHVLFGSINLQSAGYVTRYSLKKALSADLPLYFNTDTGEYLSPEKTLMSRRPGIAYEWFQRYGIGSYPDGFVVVNGMKFPTPRYYDLQLEKVDPVLFEQVKQSRLDHNLLPDVVFNNSFQRLIVRETVKLKQLDILHRDL